MPLPKGVEIFPEQARALLQPGEVPRAWESVANFAQGSQIGGKTTPDVGFSLDPVAGGVTVNPEWIGGSMMGYAAGGSVGSLADYFAQALETGPDVLLTDRRLMLVQTILGKGLSGERSFRVSFEAPRAAIQSIALAPRPIQRGRVKIDFADGSWAMAMMGVVKRSAAERLITAFNAG